ESLESVGRSSRLVSAAAKEACTTAPDGFGNRKCLCATLNRAWTSNDRELITTNRRIADANDRLFRSQVESDQFIRLTNANCLGDAAKILEVRRIDSALVSGDTDRSASRARHRMAFEAQFLNHAQNSLDLAVSRVVFHYD